MGKSFCGRPRLNRIREDGSPTEEEPADPPVMPLNDQFGSEAAAATDRGSVPTFGSRDGTGVPKAGGVRRWSWLSDLVPVISLGATLLVISAFIHAVAAAWLGAGLVFLTAQSLDFRYLAYGLVSSWKDRIPISGGLGIVYSSMTPHPFGLDLWFGLVALLVVAGVLPALEYQRVNVADPQTPLDRKLRRSALELLSKRPRAFHRQVTLFWGLAKVAAFPLQVWGTLFFLGLPYAFAAISAVLILAGLDSLVGLTLAFSLILLTYAALRAWKDRKRGARKRSGRILRSWDSLEGSRVRNLVLLAFHPWMLGCAFLLILAIIFAFFQALLGLELALQSQLIPANSWFSRVRVATYVLAGVGAIPAGCIPIHFAWRLFRGLSGRPGFRILPMATLLLPLCLTFPMVLVSIRGGWGSSTSAAAADGPTRQLDVAAAILLAVVLALTLVTVTSLARRGTVALESYASKRLGLELILYLVTYLTILGGWDAVNALSPFAILALMWYSSIQFVRLVLHGAPDWRRRTWALTTSLGAAVAGLYSALFLSRPLALATSSIAALALPLAFRMRSLRRIAWWGFGIRETPTRMAVGWEELTTSMEAASIGTE